MKRLFVLAACVVLLSGCAIPLPLKIASWAIDGISYVATGKSITDHGLSMVAQQDCAMWRPVKGEPICSDYEDSGTVVAVTDTGSNAAVEADAVLEEARDNAQNNAQDNAGATDEPVAVTVPAVVWTDPAEEGDQVEVVELARIEQENRLAETQPVDKVQPDLQLALQSDFQSALQSFLQAAPVTLPAPEMEPVDPQPSPNVASVPSGATHFYVIGSFTRKTNARRLLDQQAALDPTVITAILYGIERYRVVVGPFTRGERKNVLERIARAGIPDAWPINYDAATWVAARRSNFLDDMTIKQVAQIN